MICHSLKNVCGTNNYFFTIMKKRYIFLFLFIFFFLDFAFLPNLLVGHWRFPYFLTSFLMVFLIKNNFSKNIFIIFGGTYLLSIITGISWLVLFFIWFGIMEIISFFKFIFLENVITTWQANLIFLIIILIYFGGVVIINKFFIGNNHYFVHWFDWFFYFLLLGLFFNFNFWLENKFT